MLVEHVQVETKWTLGRPQPQGVADIVCIARNGVVVGHSQHHLHVDPLPGPLSSVDLIVREVDKRPRRKSQFMLRLGFRTIRRSNAII